MKKVKITMRVILMMTISLLTTMQAKSQLKLPELNSGTYMLKTTTENGVYNNKVIIR